MKYFLRLFCKCFFGILLIALAAGAAYGQYPATGNKQRLGFQTTGDGLVYRGTLADTTTIKPSSVNNAYFLLDTVNAKLYRYIKTRQGWQEITGGGGLTMPFDSVTFNDNQADADNAELKYNADIGSLIYGGNDGTQLPILPGHWYVRNDTSVTLTKGTVVRASGTLANSGRIKVKHMIGNGTIPAMYILGIVAKDIAPGADGYVMLYGKLRGVNTQAYQDAQVLYASATTPGALTATEPGNGFLKLPIAFVVHAASNGVLAVRVTPGSYLRDQHDVDTSGRVNNSVLRYSTSLGYWKASTTAGIVAGDTASMLSTYLRPSEILAGTGITLSKDSTVTISAPTTLSSATENKGIAEVVVDGLSTLRLPWDGTAVVGILKDYLYFFVNVNGQSSQHPLIPDGKKGDIITSQGGATLTIDTGVVSLAKLSSGVRDTLAAKLNATDTASLSTRIDTKLNASDTVSLSNRITLKLNATDTASLSNRINAKLDSIAGEVTTFTIRDTAVTTAKIATGAVTGAKLGSITSAELRTALTDATGTGAAVFGTSPTISGATITTGSINNTPIGASTANTGAFTTLTASSTLAVTGAGSIQGLTIGRGNNSFATNTALGASTLTATQTGGVSGGGQNNTAVGYQAMQIATSSQLNTAVGANALKNLTNAIGLNTAVGYNALLNTNENSNTAMGYRVMETNTSGQENAAFGYEALFDNTSGRDNVGLGYRALENNTTGNSNTALGYQSLTNNTTGSNNIGIGRLAGQSSTIGNHNIYLGVSSVGNANNNWNEIVIGSGAVGNGRNSVTLGNDTIATTILRGRVGIRQTSPLQALHVRGKARIDTLNSTPLFIAGIGTDSTIVRLSTDSLPSIAELKNVKGLNSNIQSKIDSASIYKTNGTLTGHRTVNMDVKNIYFKSSAATDDTIKIGYDAELGYNPAISFKDENIRSVHYHRGIETYSSNFGVNRRAYMYMDDGDLRFFADSSTNLGSPTADRAALNIDRNAFVQVRNLGRRAPVTITDATYTVADNVTWIICNRAGTVTLTLPNATTYTGREITVKTVQAQTVISAASNVVPITDTAAGTAILPATDGAWALLVSDGTNWIIMQKGQ